MIRHGISLLPDCRPDRRSAVEYYRGVLAISRFADTAGLDYVNTAVIGSPESVVEQITELRETYDVDTFLWNVDFGGADLGVMEPSLRLFVDKVLPNL
ncbi:hypothetical protein [Streptomyces sp. URMC 123]|uniref:hypothetical protein n=1 Tax=Streptomyces sp. URMC 123 TaxID=3423403 RepID=UPI003F1DF34B